MHYENLMLKLIFNILKARFIPPSKHITHIIGMWDIGLFH